ncbi:MAG: L,D-transpeptidase [Deltaproteobacteria bacterium]|nr:L,D-transpeptidase [Deltaproteobacteria bacterium]
MRRRKTPFRSTNLTLLVLTLLLLGIPVDTNCAKLPANLLISPKAEPHHVVLVEKASQRLFVYEFAGDYNLVATFKCATGESPGDKQASGDQKTPEGVYFFTKAVGERYLTPTYGARAFPMNYPNLWDRKMNKGGNSIWVHGTNEELKERSTNGCIVLANEDVVALENYVKLWDTPIIIEKELNYEERDSLLRQGQLLLDRVEGWSKAWSQKDLDRYLSYYASNFTWKNLDLQGWRKRKAWLNQRYRIISVQFSDIRFFRQGKMVLATAEEIYQSDRFASAGLKHLYLVQNSEEWRILAEKWRKSGRRAPPPLKLAAKPPNDRKGAEGSVHRFVEGWRRAWEEGTLSKYLACYHPRFKAGDMEFQDWKRYKEKLFHRSQKRAIQLTDIKLEVNDNRAVVVCKQEYSSDVHRDFGLKTLYLLWHGGRWTILRETWQPLSEAG